MSTFTFPQDGSLGFLLLMWLLNTSHMAGSSGEVLSVNARSQPSPNYLRQHRHGTCRTQRPHPTPLCLSDPLENSSGGKWGPPGWGPDVQADRGAQRVPEPCCLGGSRGFTEAVTWRMGVRVWRKRGGGELFRHGTSKGLPRRPNG